MKLKFIFSESLSLQEKAFNLGAAWVHYPSSASIKTKQQFFRSELCFLLYCNDPHISWQFVIYTWFQMNEIIISV
jgi:hypothetical protein